jgi:uncharacterized protein
MSAAQPKSSEPSMEEILASIRRIIADEPGKTDAPQPPAPPPAANAVKPAPAPVIEADDEEVMELKPKERVKEPHFIADDPVDNDISFAETPTPKSQDDIDALMAAAMADEQPAQPAPAMIAPVAPAPVAPAPIAPPPPAPSIAAGAMRVEPPVLQTLAPAERLISPDADRAASAAFNSLTNTILTKNARTLDDLMQEMMRPMVKQWLDDNLPTVVERLVRAEIERVARGGR